MIEIKIVGRGGQGGKSAAAVLANVALSQGKYVQSFPDYGAERQGAPVFAYTRINDTPIRLHSGVENPNVVAVIDHTLLVLPVTDGMDEKGILVVNTPHTPNEVRKKTQQYQ
jgi:pyruvate ferredoxin oxidoreductase gamma subunit